MKNKILVTGVTGKSGLCFFKECYTDKREDFEFTFLVRSKEKGQLLKAMYENTNIAYGSLDDNVQMSSILKQGNYDTLLHIAGIQKSLNLVKLAVKNGVKWLILVHTTGIYSKYKAAGEEYRQIEKQIRETISGTGIALTILRPTMIYGDLNDENVAVFMKMVYKLRLFPVVNHAEYELQPVWCGDLGKAYYQVLTTPERTKDKEYNLSGGKPIMLIDMFKTMATMLNVSNKYVNVPFWLAYSGAVLLYAISFSKFDFREKVQRLVEPRVYNHDEATRDFGYNPVSFEVGVKEEVESFLSQNKDSE